MLRKLVGHSLDWPVLCSQQPAPFISSIPLTPRFDHTLLWTNGDTRAVDLVRASFFNQENLIHHHPESFGNKTVSAIAIESVLSFAVAIAVHGIRVLIVVCSLLVEQDPNAVRTDDL